MGAHITFEQARDLGLSEQEASALVSMLRAVLVYGMEPHTTHALLTRGFSAPIADAIVEVMQDLLWWEASSRARKVASQPRSRSWLAVRGWIAVARAAVLLGRWPARRVERYAIMRPPPEPRVLPAAPRRRPRSGKGLTRRGSS